MQLKLAKKKEINEDVLRMIIQYGLGFASRVKNLENKEIEDWKEDKLYEKGAKVLYNNYLWVAKVTNQSSAWNESYWEKVGDDLELIDLDTIKTMLGLTTDELQTLSSIILDSQVRLDKTYSSSKIYTDLQQCLNDSKKFTLDQFAKANKASYQVITNLSSATDKSIIYLMANGSNYDMYIVESDGTPTKIGDTTIDLSQFYTKTEIDNDFVKKTDADGKYATITTVDGKVDKTSILSTISSNPSDDKLLSEKAIKSELDKKIDKSNIVTTIDNTVTDEQIASARAVLNSKSAKRMNESINPENYEVGDWYAEGYDGILLSTSDGHPCSEWHIGYVVTGFKTSDGKGYKKIFAITMNGNCYVKVQKWDKWTEWQKLCTTSVYDELDKKVDKTSIVTSVDSASTNTQYPSAKAVYNLAGNENRRGYVFNNPTYRGNKWNRVFRVNSLLSCDSGFLTVTVYSNGLCQIATFLMSKNFNRLNIKQINCGGYNGDKGQSRPIKVRIVSAETSGYSFLEIYVSGTTNTNVVATYMPLSCNSVVVLNEEGSIPSGMFACEMTATHDTYDSATYTSVLK